MSGVTKDKKKAIREIINQLHSGTPPQVVKKKFRQILDSISPEEIAKVEQELVREGLPREEIRKLCDVHMAVFREDLEKQKLSVPSGHPINILMEEHKIMLQLAEKLNTIAGEIHRITERAYIGTEIHDLQHIAEDFRDSEKHYLREENVLFPSLEKHGVTEPPAIMWMEHDQIRDKKKKLQKLVEGYTGKGFADFKTELGEVAKSLNDLLLGHFTKENSILFPTAMRVIAENEWKTIRREFDEIGYCCFTPSELTASAQNEEKATMASEGILQFETGSLSKKELEALLDSLPFDITFVDKNDSVRYFSNSPNRIFVRTKAIVGRKVQLCHPQKSVHIVNSIVESFKAGKKDVAEFWIQVGNRLVHIRYFSVRDKTREYLGTMEISQDITDIKKIEGERRLLDWKD